MKIRFVILIFFVAFLLQTTFLNIFAIFGVTPCLILCLLLCYLMYNKDYNGIAVALFFGFLLDVVAGELVGVTPMALLFVYFTVIGLKGNFNVENLVVAVPIALCANFIFDFSYFVIYKIFGSFYSILYWGRIELVKIVYNLVVFIGIYLIFSAVYKGKRDRYRAWGRF